MRQRLVVLVAGLVVTLVSSLLICTMWMGHIYAARVAILKVVGLAGIAVGIWLVRSDSSTRESFWRILPRCIALFVGLTVLACIGVLLPGSGLLWSPLPWEPRPFHLAQQKLFWLVGTPIYGVGLWLLDQVRFESLRLTDRRLVLPLALLGVLVTMAVVTSGYLYAHLDDGQGG